MDPTEHSQVLPHRPPAREGLSRVGDVVYEIPRSWRPDMRVPARVYADAVLIEQIQRDRSLEQLANVATLPGVVDAVYGMPDMHEGYGFPVGGVAATDVEEGVISPGGIGFDINCGVRLLLSDLDHASVAEHIERVVHEISRAIPSGYGRSSRRPPLAYDELEQVLARGVPYVVRELGWGTEDDVDSTESNGCLPGASSSAVSQRALLRGASQLGTLGGGNHFLELQVVDHVYEPEAARQLGIRKGQLVVLIHTGSRGLGHQVCSDYVRTMDATMSRHHLTVPDRQLACAPFASPEGRRYFSAMAAAANFGFCNRQRITHQVREAFARVLGPNATLRLLYDVAHNTAKVERFDDRLLCVHRKGATRAHGPSAEGLPRACHGLGQPVMIPGSMGTASYALLGTDESAGLSFSSACHGAGRAMSRGAAKRAVPGHEVRHQLQSQGIVVRCVSNKELAEEAPLAYKDVERVVDVVHRAGLAKKLARMRPVGVVKG